MKKVFLSIIFIFFISFIFFYINYCSSYRVFKINTPSEIFLDTNKNLIFDEKTPLKIKSFHCIEDKDFSYNKYTLLNILTGEEKFFIAYMANTYAKNLLHNKYVKIKNNEIYINNKKYSQLMLDTKFVFDDSEKTQKALVDNIKNFNLDEYVIYNKKNRKYHKLNCLSGQNSLDYKIIKYTKITDKDKPCKACILNKNNGIINPLKEKETLIAQKITNNYKKQNIEIFFTDLNKIFKPERKCSSDTCYALKKEIDNSKSSIDFAIYGINNQPEIFNALVSASKRGIRIRWVCDYSRKNNNYYEDSEELKQFLKDYKTDEIYERKNQSAIMHNKFFIFDNKKVWTGSSNITSTDLTGFNANYSVIIDSEKIAHKYTQEFNKMYNGKFHTEKSASDSEFININSETKIKVLFSPQDNIINTEIIPLINNAKKYIYIPIFFLTDKKTAYALINAHNRGVEIKIINDATNAHTKYTVHKQLRAAGIKVKTENYAGKMHMKAMIIDDNISVTGSMNFTKSANNKNDENVVVIIDTEIAKYFKNTFLYLWNKIPEKYEKFDPRAESTESIGSCFDGIDNNFDGKIDNEDEGCFSKQKIK